MFTVAPLTTRPLRGSVAAGMFEVPSIWSVPWLTKVPPVKELRPETRSTPEPDLMKETG